MIFKRTKYLEKLIAAQGNGLVKIVTGGRRCGKSFLLFNLFHQYLIGSGVEDSHIIELSLDDRKSKAFRDPDVLLDYIDSKISKDGKRYYIILDEIQLVDDFVEVLLSLMHTPMLDIYVSGSNSKFLSKDVVTEFRGRGEEIRIWPLSFSEYYEEIGGDRSIAWRLGLVDAASKFVDEQVAWGSALAIDIDEDAPEAEIREFGVIKEQGA